MRKSKRDNPGKPSWRRRLIGWAPLVLVVGLWAYSYVSDMGIYATGSLGTSGTLVGMSLYPGEIQLQWNWDYDVTAFGVGWFHKLHPIPSRNLPALFLLLPRLFPHHTTMYIFLPCWIPTPPAALWLWFLVFRRRPIPGYCPKCDYDLRGSVRANTCPECGADVKWVAPKELQQDAG